MSHRRQSFCLILSVSLLLSRRPDHARESVGRRISPSIIGGAKGSAPANPPPREQVRSRPTVDVSVQGPRQRAQGRRERMPATTCQRSARASCYGVRSQFWPRGRDTYSAWLQCQPSPSRLGRRTHQTWCTPTSEASPCPLVAYRAHQVQSGATKLHLPRLLLKVASVAIPVDQWRERPDPPSCHNRAHNGKDFHGRAGRPKNNGYSESSPVTAVTAAEAGSVACCTSGRYGSTDGFPVTAEAGGPYPSGTGLPAPNEADREGCVQIHELRSRTEASCPSQRAHRRIDG